MIRSICEKTEKTRHACMCVKKREKIQHAILYKQICIHCNHAFFCKLCVNCERKIFQNNTRDKFWDCFEVYVLERTAIFLVYLILYALQQPNVRIFLFNNKWSNKEEQRAVVQITLQMLHLKKWYMSCVQNEYERDRCAGHLFCASICIHITHWSTLKRLSYS